MGKRNPDEITTPLRATELRTRLDAIFNQFLYFPPSSTQNQRLVFKAKQEGKTLDVRLLIGRQAARDAIVLEGDRGFVWFSQYLQGGIQSSEQYRTWIQPILDEIHVAYPRYDWEIVITSRMQPTSPSGAPSLTPGPPAGLSIRIQDGPSANDRRFLKGLRISPDEDKAEIE